MSIIPRPVPVLKQTPSHGWIYIIRADSGHYKIGKSKRPDKRVGEFTLQLPFKVEIVHLIECEDYHLAEKMLHTFCADYHVNGEWFQLPEQSLPLLKSWPVLTLEDAESNKGVSPDLIRQMFHFLVFGKDAWDEKYGEAAQ